ncbi:MAG: hypothetical protein M3384_18295 [Acidobacteriota bacterium]|nr:hypothetical protein [Acidobacteriota bacterium]
MKIYFTIAVILLFALTVIAQTGKKSGGKRVSAKKVVPVAEMTDLASPDVCVDPTKHSAPVDGVIVKREFDADEIMLTGVTVREANDERYFVNIDTEYVASKGRFVPRELSSILTKGRRVKIWVYGCGASGMMFWARAVKAY